MNKEQLLDKLRADIDGCHKCALSKTRTNIVFGAGTPYSPLMIVGEGPGATEDETGRPFVGKAGMLLTECLRECRIERRHIYIANVLKCRACIVGERTVKNRPPAPEEVEQCKKWLMAQLDILQPLVILTLGAPATKLVLDRQNVAMTKERGRFYLSPYGIPVIPSLHPSYILRNMYKDGDGGKSLLVSDIEAARKKIIEIKRSASAASVKEPDAETQENKPAEKAAQDGFGF